MSSSLFKARKWFYINQLYNVLAMADIGGPDERHKLLSLGQLLFKYLWIVCIEGAVNSDSTNLAIFQPIEGCHPFGFDGLTLT